MLTDVYFVREDFSVVNVEEQNLEQQESNHELQSTTKKQSLSSLIFEYSTRSAISP